MLKAEYTIKDLLKMGVFTSKKVIRNRISWGDLAYTRSPKGEYLIKTDSLLNYFRDHPFAERFGKVPTVKTKYAKKCKAVAKTKVKNPPEFTLNYPTKKEKMYKINETHFEAFECLQRLVCSLVEHIRNFNKKAA